MLCLLNLVPRSPIRISSPAACVNARSFLPFHSSLLVLPRVHTISCTPCLCLNFLCFHGISLRLHHLKELVRSLMLLDSYTAWWCVVGLLLSSWCYCKVLLEAAGVAVGLRLSKGIRKQTLICAGKRGLLNIWAFNLNVFEKMEHCYTKKKNKTNPISLLFFFLLHIKVTDLLRKETSWTLFKNRLSRGEDRRGIIIFRCIMLQVQCAS